MWSKEMKLQKLLEKLRVEGWPSDIMYSNYKCLLFQFKNFVKMQNGLKKNIKQRSSIRTINMFNKATHNLITRLGSLDISCASDNRDTSTENKVLSVHFERGLKHFIFLKSAEPLCSFL